MPLPSKKSWPPAELDVITPSMREWNAWYSNDTDVLTYIYGGGRSQATGVGTQGVVNTIKRWFWGTPTSATSSPKKLHLPIASDICQASADLLFAEPPAFTVDDKATQERLDLIIGADAHDQLASSAEVSAALGGTYMRVVWDSDLLDHPFIARVDADRAIPTFRWGRLADVIFWREVRREGGTVWRHLELHEVRNGIGVIEHGLYAGTDSQLGGRVQLTEAPATEGLAAVVDANSTISTETPGLDVMYVPNQSPNRTWRNHPIGANLGRSDLDGIEPLMDAMDEVWSSWMRDIRLGKARIVASRSALEDNGPGKGANMDLDREVYEAVNTPPGAANSSSGLPIDHIQFAIRVQEHQDTAAALLAQILRTAGYSAQTFGSDGESGMTATEVHSRERRSFMTRDRKIRPWRPALQQLAQKALAIDAVVFRSGAKADLEVQVEFGDSVQDGIEVMARTSQLLFQAQATSTRTRVAMLHPDWDEESIDREVALIQEENGGAMADPDAIGRGGLDLSGEFEDRTAPEPIDPEVEVEDER